MALPAKARCAAFAALALFAAACRTAAPPAEPENAAALAAARQSARNKAQAAAALDQAGLLAESEPERARDLFISIDPSLLEAEALRQYRLLEKRFSFIKMDAAALGLAHANVSALAIDGEDLWAGDWLGGFARYSLATREVFTAREGRPSLDVRSLNSILVEKDTVWGVAGDAVVRYNKRTSEVELVPRPSFSGYPQQLARYEGVLYLATQNSGLWEYKAGSFVKSALDRPFLRVANGLLVWQGRLWAAAGSGLHYYENGAWQTVEPFKNQEISSLTAYGDFLWAGSLGFGLRSYNFKTKETKLYPLRDGWLSCGLAVGDRLFFGMLEGGLASIGPQGRIEQEKYTALSPSLLRIGSLAYYDPYLLVGTLGDALFFIHKSLF